MMKTKYILLLTLISVSFSYGQIIWDGSENDNWSEALNWNVNTVPAAGDEVEIIGYSIVNEAITIAELNTSGVASFTLNASNILTIDTNSESSQVAFDNNITSGETFTLEGSLVISNSNEINSASTTLRNLDSNNTLSFGTGSNFVLNTNATVNNAGTFNFDGVLQDGDSGRLAIAGAGTTNFVSDFGLNTANVVFTTSFATVNFTHANSSVGTKGLYFNGGTGAEREFYVNLNAENSVRLSKIEVRDNSIVNMNVNHDSDNIGVLTIQDATLNLQISGGVTVVEFDDSFGEWNVDAILNITGIAYTGDANIDRKSNVRFGTTETGLSVNDVSKINIVGGAGEPMALTPDGYLILESELAGTSPYNYTKTFEGNTDLLWSKPSNWDANEIPGSNASYIDEDDVLTSLSSDIDADFSITGFVAAGASNVTLSSSTDNLLTIDPKSSSNETGISNQLDAGTTLIIDSKVTFENTSADNKIFIRNQTSTNTLEFGAGKDITVNDHISVLNTGTVNFKGSILGTAKRVTLANGSGVFNFESKIVNNTIGEIRLNGNSLTANFNSANPAADNETPMNPSMKLAVWENRTVTLNFNAENSVQVNEFHLNSGSTAQLNISENHEDIGKIVLDPNSTLNIDVTGVACSFLDSEGEWDLSSSLNITGFEEYGSPVGIVVSNVRIGDGTGNDFGADQLSLITVTDGAGDSYSAEIDENGYLILREILSVKKINSFEFSMYPNPVMDMLKIQSKENLEKIEILNSVGRTVMLANINEQGIDVSSLKTGVYIVKLTSENGVSTAKFVKK